MGRHALGRSRWRRPLCPRIGVRLRGVAALVLGALVWCASPAVGQQVLLDAPVQAGDLTVYPVLGENLEPGSDYYYVPTRARLAEDARGRPQFSFLRYVENVRPGEDEETAREGEGGGIVHAVVQLDVEDATVRAAESALQRVRPGARIVGPVVYRSGTFGLVSSFVQEDGDLTRQVVGLGAAPVLEGSKAAISMRLTKLGAKILWESFEMPQPDISFVFEMQMEGLRAPIRARLEADWDRMYRHTAFGAAVATPVLAGEVAAAFDDLRDQGAIRLVQVGQDAQMDKMVQVAYDKLATLMFEPLDGTGMPSLGQLAGQGAGDGLLDRATTMLADARAEADRTAQRVADATPAANRQRNNPPAAQPRADAPRDDNRAEDDGEADGAEDRNPDDDRAASAAGNPPNSGEDRGQPSGETDDQDDARAQEATGANGITPPPPATQQAEASRRGPEPQGDDAGLSCNLKLAYWVAAELVRADERERQLAGYRKYLDVEQPNDIAATRTEVEAVPADADRRAHIWDLRSEERAFTHWKQYVEATEAWVGRRRSSLARDRSRVDPEIFDRAANDPRTDDLGEARATLDLRRDEHAWIDSVLSALRRFEDENQGLGPAAVEKLATVKKELQGFEKDKQQEHENAGRRTARLEHSVGLFRAFSGSDCPDAQPSSVESTDPFLTKKIDVEELPAVSEEGEIEAGDPGAAAGVEGGDRPAAQSPANRTDEPDDEGAESGGADDAAGDESDRKANGAAAGGAEIPAGGDGAGDVSDGAADDGAVAGAAGVGGGAAGGGGGGGGGGDAASGSRPGIAAVATLQLRRTRQRGTFELDMNKYMAGSQPITFSQPIGDVSRYKDDETVFRQVNLDQPLFRQREVAFRLDGLNAEDFGEYVNFIHVQLRRGADVREELTVGAEEFNERGHDFRLLYGFSGEESRDEWMRYEYRTVWSLFGGLDVEQGWEQSRDGTVALPAPYIRRTVELEGDPGALEGVRAVTARLYYTAGEEERFSELTLRPDRGETVGTADVLLPVGETEYGYEILWLYGNNDTVSSGRQRTSNPLLFLDPPQE